MLFLSEWLSVMEKSLSVLILDFYLICKVGNFDSLSDDFDLSHYLVCPMYLDNSFAGDVL